MCAAAGTAYVRAHGTNKHAATRVASPKRGYAQFETVLTAPKMESKYHQYTHSVLKNQQCIM